MTTTRRLAPGLELAEKIFADYPELYSKCDDFYVGPGWLPLIYKLSAELAACAPDVRVMQVKNKFGGLRFYIEAGSPATHVLIELAETASFGICDQCGEPGEPRGESWVATRCERHTKC
jgi:hypothetical protein